MTLKQIIPYLDSRKDIWLLSKKGKVLGRGFVDTIIKRIENYDDLMHIDLSNSTILIDGITTTNSAIVIRLNY